MISLTKFTSCGWIILFYNVNCVSAGKIMSAFADWADFLALFMKVLLEIVFIITCFSCNLLVISCASIIL